MSHFEEFTYSDSTAIDAAGRLRTSAPKTIFDSKQIFDNDPQFWDEELESGAGIASAHSVDESSTVFTSTVNTAGKFTRQTFMRFNYQSGKSQFISMTGVLNLSGGGTGVERRIGYFDDKDGLFFEINNTTVGVTRRTNVTGTPVDNTVTQSNWNVDKMDGTGPSGATVDFSKMQIFEFDFEWLSSGRIRFALKINKRIFVVHEIISSNILTMPFMSKPNLPLRYQMITTGSSPASTMRAVCTTVISEGGQEETGILRRASTGGTHVEAAVNDTIYAVVGIRLKSTHLAASIDLVNISMAEYAGNKAFEWILIFNPTVEGTFTYGDETNSAIQSAKGAAANTVTGGTEITGAFSESAQKGGPSIPEEVKSLRKLGATIDGVVDEIVLCVRPVNGSINLDIEGSITWRQGS